MLLTKFENKSARVKGLSFHKSRPWLLASLHTGVIQLWDYRIPTLLDRFDNHDGPVRGIDFHCQQPLFVSGGDDFKIKVWNHKMRKCLFTLLGHLDYIRTTFFHHEYPWILSTSDDQTIRIWNWQSRHCISILPGHNYYVMSAHFHPTEDLIISASLDQTVRIWDFSGLRKKNVYSGPETIQTQMQRASGTPDIFGQADTVVRFVLEGHERGVNWATFHPTLSLAASSGDDRQIKLWRMNESRAWELDTCRGHHNNVSCVLFHPTRDLLISTSEDKTLKIWDLAKRLCIHTVKRENDRFWILARHPNMNLFAAGHDSGFIVFKLERERPSFAITPNGYILYVKDNVLRRLEVKTQNDAAVQPLRSVDGCKIHSINYNHAEKCIIVIYRSLSKQDDSYYQICKITGSDKIAASEESPVRSNGLNAVWISWNKFAVLTLKGKISIRNLKNQEQSAIDEFPHCDEIFQGIEGTLLIREHNNIHLFDLITNKKLSSINARKTKHIIWSEDKKILALISKTGFKLTGTNLEEICTISENARVKSGIFEHSNEVFIYTTNTHVKYALQSGSTGILCTINVPLYIIKAVDDKVFVCLNRACVPQLFTMETTEFQFKLALEKKRYDEVVKIVRKCNLIGQSTIAYLYRKGYPEIALRFVDNKKTRYGLAIQCGDLQAAFAVARELDQTPLWGRLAKASIQQGKFSIAEVAYQKLRQLDRLTTLYALTGNFEKLEKISKIADVRGDCSVQYSLCLITGNVDKEIEILESNSQYLLAYYACLVNNRKEKAETILNILSNSTEIDVQTLKLPVPKTENVFKPLVPLHTLLSDFPILLSNQSFLDCISDAATGRESSDDHTAFKFDFREEESIDGQAWLDDETQIDLLGKSDLENDGVESVHDDEQEGWQCEDIWTSSTDIDIKEFIPISLGVDRLVSNLASSEYTILDYVHTGKFEVAFQTLRENYGIVRFNAYIDIFLKFYTNYRLSLKGVSPYISSLVCYPIGCSEDQKLEHDEAQDSKNQQISIESLTATLQRAYKFTTSGKFSDSVKLFREILLSLPLLTLSSRYEKQQAKQLSEVCLQYILGQQVELARRSLLKSNPENVKRLCELSLYFSHCNLQRGHKILALKTAQYLCFKNKNYKTAIICGRNLLHCAPSEDITAQARKINDASETHGGMDSMELDYDDLNPFDLCAASHTPIYRGCAVVSCPLCGACYLPKYKGEICRVTQATEIGIECSGLKQL